MQEEWPLKYSAICLTFQKVKARPLVMVRRTVFSQEITHFSCARAKGKIKP